MRVAAEPLTGANHPATSVSAARFVNHKTGKQRERIEAFVLSCGEDGATSDEIGLALDMPAQSVSPRLLELRGEARNYPHAAVLVIKRASGRDVTRKAASGTAARVHVHVMFAQPAGQMNLLAVIGA